LRPPAVLYEKRGSIALVSLNRPEVLNAYNVAMRDALYETLLAVRDDPEVRAMVLRGNGPAFCTGGDVKEFGTAPSPLGARAARWGRDVWGTLRALRQPTLAAVHGYAVGGGWEMALLCDQCLASDDARFSLPETGLAMIPGVGGTQTAPRALGLGRAMDCVLTGRWLTAREAFELGLVTRVVSSAGLDAAALATAERLAAMDASLLHACKRAVWDGLDLPLAAGLELEARLAAQFERRAPRGRGAKGSGAKGRAEVPLPFDPLSLCP
jgi:enoyl-CoA hydratase/carnithine racemase